MLMYACPVCKEELRRKEDALECANDICDSTTRRYMIMSGIPVLIPFGMEHCVLSPPKETASLNLGSKRRDLDEKTMKLKSLFRKVLMGENSDTRRNFTYLARLLADCSSRVLVIGGGTVGSGANDFYDHCKSNNISIESIDVYASSHCSVVADAHYLPFSDECFDMVIIQAVLEHVANPEKVVGEIRRVLTRRGIVYAETPFMQCVHEGPYDFTRFTNSGHRYLFRDFDEISSGVHHGAFSSSLFVVSYAISGLLRTRYAGIVLRSVFTRLAKVLDSMTPDSWNTDVACGNYFIGSKGTKDDREVNSSWIADYYRGAQRK